MNCQAVFARLHPQHGIANRLPQHIEFDIAKDRKAQRIADAAKTLLGMLRRQQMDRCMFDRVMLTRATKKLEQIMSEGPA